MRDLSIPFQICIYVFTSKSATLFLGDLNIYVFKYVCIYISASQQHSNTVFRRTELSSAFWWKNGKREDKIFFINTALVYWFLSKSLVNFSLFVDSYVDVQTSSENRKFDQTLNRFNCSWNYALEKDVVFSNCVTCHHSHYNVVRTWSKSFRKKCILKINHLHIYTFFQHSDLKMAQTQS